MRKIKFRYVYRNADTEEIKIVIKDITQIEKDNEPYLDGWVLISRDEFTSLTDKNGKEIYEGDIVKYEIDTYSDDTDFVSAKIEWSECDTRYVLVNDDQYIHEEFDGDSCENCIVIGSIHDNPELLNSK